MSEFVPSDLVVMRTPLLPMEELEAWNDGLRAPAAADAELEQAIAHGRPLLRGRKEIFGAGADYGKTVNAGAPVWRAGANDTTRMTTQVPIQIGGKTLAPGVYNVFVDLKPGNWTLVLSTQPVQEKFDPNDKVRLSGATNYDPKFDVVRAPMSVRQVDASTEQFTIGFTNVSDTRATLSMAWDKTLATVDLTIAGASK